MSALVVDVRSPRKKPHSYEDGQPTEAPTMREEQSKHSTPMMRTPLKAPVSQGSEDDRDSQPTAAPSFMEPPGENICTENTTAKGNYSASRAAMPLKPITLTKLPDELILEVCHAITGIAPADDQLYGEIGRQSLATLVNLALTNRHMHQVVKPLLYRNLNGLGFQLRRGLVLLRTLVENPAVAADVEAIHWNCSNEGSMSTTIADIEEQDILDVVSSKSCSYMGDLVPAIRNACKSGGLLASMIQLMSNLRYVHIKGSEGPPRNPITRKVTGMPDTLGRHMPIPLQLLHLAAVKPDNILSKHFDKLHTLRIRDAAIPYQALYGIFQLPSLRTVKLEGFSTRYSSTPIASECPTRASPITSLYLDNISFRPKHFERMLSYIKALRFLRVEEKIYSSNKRIVRSLHFPEVMGAIRQHKDSLEELSITETRRGTQSRHRRDEKRLDSLQALSRIKRLTVTLDTLVAFPDPYTRDSGSMVAQDLTTTLPPNIERLELLVNEDALYRTNDVTKEVVHKRQRCDYALQTMLASLASGASSQLPLLKEVHVAFVNCDWATWDCHRPKGCHHLYSMLSRKGIDLDMTVMKSTTRTRAMRNGVAGFKSVLDSCEGVSVRLPQAELFRANRSLSQEEVTALYLQHYQRT